MYDKMLLNLGLFLLNKMDILLYLFSILCLYLHYDICIFV